MRTSWSRDWSKTGSAARAREEAPPRRRRMGTETKARRMITLFLTCGEAWRWKDASRYVQLDTAQQRHIVPSPAGLGREQRVQEALHHHVAHEAQPVAGPPGQAPGEHLVPGRPDVARAVARPREPLVGPVVVEAD